MYIYISIYIYIYKFYSSNLIKFLNVVAGFGKMLKFEVQHVVAYIKLKQTLKALI